HLDGRRVGIERSCRPGRVVDQKAHLLQLRADGAVKDNHLAAVNPLGERFVVRHSIPPITRSGSPRRAIGYPDSQINETWFEAFLVEVRLGPCEWAASYWIS